MMLTHIFSNHASPHIPYQFNLLMVSWRYFSFHKWLSVLLWLDNNCICVWKSYDILSPRLKYLTNNASLFNVMLVQVRAGCRVATWCVFINNRMSKCELIELKDLSVNDPIELAAPAPRRAPPVHPGQPSHFQVVRLVGDSVSIEASRRHTGDAWDGHDFQPYNHTYLTWCDLCGEFIWGLYKQSLRCNSEYWRIL